EHAVQMEKDLADDLRAQGYTVAGGTCGNHHFARGGYLATTSFRISTGSSLILFSTYSAAFSYLRGSTNRRSGIAATRIFAALPAAMPGSASSTTRHASAGIPRCSAVHR